MTVTTVNNDINKDLQSPLQQTADCGIGPLGFVYDVIKRLGEALLLAIGVVSIVGIPFIWYAYKPNTEQQPSAIPELAPSSVEHNPNTDQAAAPIPELDPVEHEPGTENEAAPIPELAPPVLQIEAKQEGLLEIRFEEELEKYIGKVKGREVDPTERERLNSELGIKIATILSQEGIQNAYQGILHPLFKEFMDVRMFEALEGAPDKIEKEKIILAYGFEEDQAKNVLYRHQQIALIINELDPDSNKGHQRHILFKFGFDEREFNYITNVVSWLKQRGN
ncbi:MAG: hypothetical protein K1X28_00545 [Parachlamydiales bacterium]|nr:hypothetical protein [Parachlamydiales bacterium]